MSILAPFLIFVFFVLLNLFYFYRATQRIATYHKEVYEDLDLPERVWHIFIVVSPINLLNLFKFIFSRNFLKDINLKYYKRMYRITFFAVLVTAIFLSYVFIASAEPFPDKQAEKLATAMGIVYVGMPNVNIGVRSRHSTFL